MLQKVIDKFNLIDVFKIDRNNKEYFERTLKTLRNSIDTKISEEQVFKITVTMPSPKISLRSNKLHCSVVEFYNCRTGY